MAYRNKTYVCFASEDIKSYYLMTAWKANEHIDFNFHDAHDIAIALDTSQKETIRRRLRERLANTKQAVLLIGDVTRTKAANSSKFLHYELEVLLDLEIPIVVSNLNGSREAQTSRMPKVLTGDYYTVSTSFQPKIIQYGLDEHVPAFKSNLTATSSKKGPHQYKASIYTGLGL